MPMVWVAVTSNPGGGHSVESVCILAGSYLVVVVPPESAPGCGSKQLPFLWRRFVV